MSINTIYDDVLCCDGGVLTLKLFVLIIDYYASPASQAAAQVVNINVRFVARIP